VQFDRIGVVTSRRFRTRRDHADGAERGLHAKWVQICRVKAATEVLPLVP